jgi:hypothetical protein
MGEFNKHAASFAGEVPPIRRDDDFLQWLLNQVSLLRSRNYAALDSANLAEELEEMAAQQRGKVVSLLRVVLVHLLKWHYSKNRRSERSWTISLVRARIEVSDIFEDSRTLRNELPSMLTRAYRGARSVAGTEMQMAKRDWQHLFPVVCPWTESQVLDEDFLPEIAPDANGRT